PSVNHDNRVQFVIVHYTSTSLERSLALLTHGQVSSHYLIGDDASGTIYKLVDESQRAWHAGTSTFSGRPQCNGYSIGIEMEGSDFVPFQPRQYHVLAALTAALAVRYGLGQVRGHEHIAPGRKTDPGPFFDWNYYQECWLEAQGEQPALALTSRVLGFPPVR
ncbi:MAG: N-acetylmuramoyl-L-alanine amidase, partial [Janthinobacterium sp.]